MAVPDEEQTRQALERVEKEGREPGLGEVIWHELNLSDPRWAKKSAEQFREKESRLDILGPWNSFSRLVTSLIELTAVNNAALCVLF